MYCAGVLTFDGGFMDSSSSRTKCITERKPANGRGSEYRLSTSRAQARRLLSVLKVISRREGGGRVLVVHGAGSVQGPPSQAVLMAAPRHLPLGCRTHPGVAASPPPPRASLRTPRGRPRSLSHARLRPHHLALPTEGGLKRTLAKQTISRFDLLRPQRIYGFNCGRAARRHKSCNESAHGQCENGARQGQRIEGLDAEQPGAENASRGHHQRHANQ